ncbi:MAG: TolC family protein [Kiritimatiellae bacterium]|nr:TolC family protein [Kiritimatiellia bacterium]
MPAACAPLAAGVLLLAATAGCALFPRGDYTVSPLSPALTRPGFTRIAEPNPCLPGAEGEAGALESLSLDACMQLALDRNRALKRALSALDRARQELRVARATILEPALSASYSAIDDEASGRLSIGYDSPLGLEIEPYLQLEYDEDSAPSHTAEAGLSVSRRVFGTAEHVRLSLPLIRARKALLEAANDLVRRTRELRYELIQAFFSLQRAQVRFDVRENRVKDAQAFLAATRDMVANGFAAPVDELNARINLNQAELDRVREITQVTTAKESLLALLAFNIDADISIEPQDVARLPDFDPALDADVAHVLRRHETLVNQRLDVDLADKEIRVQRDLLKPQVTLGLSAKTGWEGEAFFESETDDDNFSVDIAYKAALDFNRKDRAKLVQLEKRQYELLSSLKDNEDKMEIRLRALYRKIDELRQSVGLAAERFKAEERKLAATLKRYESGNVDNLEVTRAKQDLVDAEIRLLDAQIDLFLRRAEYDSLLPPRDENDPSEK